jgi:hypothetical protein
VTVTSARRRGRLVNTAKLPVPPPTGTPAGLVKVTVVLLNVADAAEPEVLCFIKAPRT